MSVTLPEVTPITINDITTGSVNGTGIFDKLMQTVAAQLLSEFQAGRITKTDYGQVYLAALNATMQQAIQFALSKDQAALQAATLAAQYELIAYQKEALILQNDKLELEKAQLVLANAQLTLQNEKLAIEKDIASQQVLLTAAQVAKTKSDIDANTAQIALINQKKVTEIAQTTDGYNGVVGKQISLYNAQITGFTRDAEQKAAKLALDVLSTQISVDDTTTVENTNMHNAAIGAFVAKLATGVGVTIPSA